MAHVTSTPALRGLRWIRTTHADASDKHNSPTCWKPVYVLREAEALPDCKYYIAKSVDGKYCQYHLNELHETLDYKQCRKKQLYQMLLQSLQSLFAQDVVGTQRMYMSAGAEPAAWNMLTSYFTLSRSADIDGSHKMPDLQRVTDLEFHCDSYAADAHTVDEEQRERQINAVWLKTECMTEAKYCSLSRIRTVHYVDDHWQHVADPCDEVIVCDDTHLFLDDDDDDEDDQKWQQEMEQLKLQSSRSAQLIQHLQHENRRLSTANKACGRGESGSAQLHEELLSEKQQEIDRLRRELIARSNAKQLDSKFATVEEVCSQYRSIKNQEFQCVHSKLTKPVRRIHRDWNKYYVSKLSHRLLFETLIECYGEVLSYHDAVYSSIARVLCMDDEDEDEAQSNKATLEFLFHRYLTTNFERMRDSEQMKHIKHEKILQSVRDKYGEIVRVLSSEEQHELWHALSAFIQKCCDVCWSMVLQRPQLSVSPTVFQPTHKTEFNEKKHARVLGSNKTDKYILYYVWPAIAHNGIELETVKSYVVQRDTDFAPPN